MKKTKSEKTELERRLEEEMLKERLDEGTQDALTPEEEMTVLGEATEHDMLRLAAEMDEMRDQLMRARADFDNYRKRTARDHERMRQMAAESLMRALLPVMDHLELAILHKDDTSGSLIEGVELVLKQFSEVLQQHGLRPIAAEGEDFNPRIHEAVTQLPSTEIPEDKVAKVFQRGYTIGEQVIRPARVAVSSGASTTNET